MIKALQGFHSSNQTLQTINRSKVKGQVQRLVPLVAALAFIGLLLYSNAAAPTPQISQIGYDSGTKNLSPQQMLWSNFKTKEEQEEGIRRVLPAIQWLNRVMPQQENAKYKRNGGCPVVTMGKDWGAHDICDIPNSTKEDPCNFISFGISRDYSFDTDMAEKRQCRGFAADPTVDHGSKLHDLVSFNKIGATLLIDSIFDTITMPSVMTKELKAEKIQVLKMDCEGCEYALPRDVLLEDPLFFHKVDQLSVEIHLTKSKMFMKDDEAFYYFGLLMQMLMDAGMEVQTIDVTSCHNRDEKLGCNERLKQIGYPCGKKNSCQNILFARDQ